MDGSSASSPSGRSSRTSSLQVWPPPHGLSSNKMALITSYRGIMRTHEHQMALITSECAPLHSQSPSDHQDPLARRRPPPHPRPGRARGRLSDSDVTPPPTRPVSFNMTALITTNCNALPDHQNGPDHLGLRAPSGTLPGSRSRPPSQSLSTASRCSRSWSADYPAYRPAHPLGWR